MPTKELYFLHENLRYSCTGNRALLDRFKTCGLTVSKSSAELSIRLRIPFESVKNTLNSPSVTSRMYGSIVQECCAKTILVAGILEYE